MSPNYDELQARAQQAELMWRLIAHERVKERLDRLFSVAAFLSGWRASEDEAYRTYASEASKLQNSTSRIPSRELEEAVFRLEDAYVQKALEIYRDETPRREITDVILLWHVYNLGLVPFIETRILRDTCFRLDKAQPSLGLNTLRPDGERFFSYRSERLKQEFPIVIRIVDRLKAEYADKIAALARQMTTKVEAVSVEDASTNVSPSQKEAGGESAQAAPVEASNASEAAPVTKTPIFTHSETYDSITFNGKSYTLQERQAEVIRFPHDAAKKGRPAVPKRRLLAIPGCEDVTSVRDIFKSRPELWGELIVNCEETGEGRGFYRLSPLIDGNPPD